VSDQIKNRVVGAIVLFTLAIIFIPKIFDGEKQSQRREFVAIPKKPIVEPTQINTPINNDSVPLKIKASESSESKEQVRVDTPALNIDPIDKINTQTTINKEVATKPDEKDTVLAKPTLKTTNGIKAKAWVLRMGSFGNPDNVNALVKKLRNKGYTAFSVPRIPKAGISNKVFIGPELKQSVLVKFQPQLKRDFKESGVIEKYNPVQ